MNENTDQEIMRFDNFEVWQETHQLVLDTYRLTSLFDNDVSDLRKDLIQSAQNISKFVIHGFNHRNPNDKFSSYESALNATYVYHNLLLIAKDLGSFGDNQEDYETLLDKIISSRKRIVGLVRKYREISGHK